MRDPQKKIIKDEKTGRVRVITLNALPSMTQQQFKKECDINNIIKKFHDTGEWTHLTQKGMRYGDFSEIQDYQAMLDTVIYAQEAFGALPATLRKRFDNDPGKLLQFLQDESNRDEAIKLGLVKKPDETINNADEIKTTSIKTSTTGVKTTISKPVAEPSE